MAVIDEIISKASERRASDVHTAVGSPVRFRVDGFLVDADERILTTEDCEELAKQIAGDNLAHIARAGELDLARTFAGKIRCRINIYRTQGAYSVAIRLLSNQIPALSELGLPAIMMQFPDYQRGIILITGETGSGKSTTLAAIINEITQKRRDHIVTLEDPIEYIYTADKCSIDQREIGCDVHSFADGLRASLRQDPDVILVGEMRDRDTIETALTAAETGHLVFGTLHTYSAADSIDRIVNVFPEGQQRQIRLQLSQTLKAVVSQQLLLRKEGIGRVVACEVMMVNSAIRNLIREGKTPQIMNALATSAAEGSITMDNMLLEMVKRHQISVETAIGAANDQEYVSRAMMS